MTDNERIPLLLDTDIGTDIDDAVCLAYLLRQPRCELLGITTVTGEARERAMLADAVCRAAGREDVPIHSGAEQPLFIPQMQQRAQQAEALAHFSHRADFPPNTAVEFLRQTIRERPGQITLLAIGPLTNIGLLFAVDPEIPALLKGLVLMAGIFTIGGPGAREWNVLGDPHAAALVYRAKVATHLSYGLDVTTQCRMEAEECRRRFRGGPLDMVGQMAEVWFRHAGQITFHDPLAGACIFQPDLCTYQDGRVEVATGDGPLAGLTRWDQQAEEKPHQIAVGVNPERFFTEYFSITG